MSHVECVLVPASLCWRGRRPSRTHPLGASGRGFYEDDVDVILQRAAGKPVLWTHGAKIPTESVLLVTQRVMRDQLNKQLRDRGVSVVLDASGEAHVVPFNEAHIDGAINGAMRNVNGTFMYETDPIGKIVRVWRDPRTKDIRALLDLGENCDPLLASEERGVSLSVQWGESATEPGRYDMDVLSVAAVATPARPSCYIDTRVDPATGARVDVLPSVMNLVSASVTSAVPDFVAALERGKTSVASADGDDEQPVQPAPPTAARERANASVASDESQPVQSAPPPPPPIDTHTATSRADSSTATPALAVRPAFSLADATRACIGDAGYNQSGQRVVYAAASAPSFAMAADNVPASMKNATAPAPAADPLAGGQPSKSAAAPPSTATDDTLEARAARVAKVLASTVDDADGVDPMAKVREIVRTVMDRSYDASTESKQAASSSAASDALRVQNERLRAGLVNVLREEGKQKQTDLIGKLRQRFPSATDAAIRALEAALSSSYDDTTTRAVQSFAMEPDSAAPLITALAGSTSLLGTLAAVVGSDGGAVAAPPLSHALAPSDTLSSAMNGAKSSAVAAAPPARQFVSIGRALRNLAERTQAAAKRT